MGDTKTTFEDDPVLAVFKIGRQRHIDELVAEGHVYMNPASYFRTLEGTLSQADPHEAASYALAADGATFSVERDGTFVPIATLAGPIVGLDPDLVKANLYCLHSRRRSDDDVFSLERLNFGEAAALFRDFDEFLRRLTRSVQAAGYELQHRPVEYVDPKSHRGPMGLFRKFAHYAAQGEWRIAVLPGTGKPLSFRLGDLSDIAMVIPTKGNLKLRPKVHRSDA